MTEKEIAQLTYLKTMFEKALQVCDPLDHQVRQRNLLYAIASHLIDPLREETAGKETI